MNKGIANIKPLKRIHGGKNTLNLPNKDIVYDFSVSVNPYGPPEGIKLNFTSDRVKEYPDPESKKLTKLIASLNNVKEENIFIGNGSAEIITLLFFCFTKTRNTILSLWPSFGEYQHYANILQLKFIPIKLNPSDFRLNLNAINKIIQKYQPRLFFFCNPNNPTGSYYSKEEIICILKKLPRNSLLILDEAYVNLVLSRWNSVDLLKQFNNLIILRSLTKDYSLTAFRLGYSIATKDVTNILKSACHSWNINFLSQENGLFALEDKTFLKKTIPSIHKEKNRIVSILKNLGFDVIPSAANFYLLRVNNAGLATHLLLSNNIYVRDCTSYNLPQYLRISVNLPKENYYLLRILKKLANEIKP